MTVQALPLHGETRPVRDGPREDSQANEIPAGLPVPPYLYVTGTVNTDETTHAFSPKVLDRAFTIEFNDVYLRETRMGGESHGDRRFGEELSQLLARVSPPENEVAFQRALQDRRLMDWLEALNERLQPYDLHFAYRVRNEIGRFVGYAMASPLVDGFREHTQDTLIGAFDAAVLMKVLPKFHGPRAKVYEPLVAVLAWAFDPSHPDEATVGIRKCLEASIPGADSLLKEVGGVSKFVLQRVAQKTARMLWEATTVGFTSFA
jgi:hypothetical protein